jgi:hypothetical protein
MREVTIKISVDQAGNARIDHGQLNALQAALILSQVIVQLQTRAIQESGGSVIALPGLGPLAIGRG